jgi:hypothetical protein
LQRLRWQTPTVNQDGRQLAFEVLRPLKTAVTLVPLRAIFEAMGATVRGTSNPNASAVKDDTKVVLKIGSTKPTKNGKVKPLDVPAKIVNGRTRHAAFLWAKLSAEQWPGWNDAVRLRLFPRNIQQS